MRERILRHASFSDLETTLETVDEYPEPDMRRQKLPISAVGSLPCPEAPGPMHFVDALRRTVMAKLQVA